MKEQDPLRILIVDDHPVVRRGIATILIDSYPHAIVKEACSASEALTSVRNDRWALVILDLMLPDGSGLEVLKQIRSEQTGLPVMILSIHPVEQCARRAVAAGASGYLTKDAAGADLTSAVARLIGGGEYFANTISENVISGTAFRDERQLHERLSDREYEVLRLIGEGKTVSEVAQRLTLRVSTVSTYRVRLLRKMEMRTNAELVRYAIRTGLSRP